MNKRILIALIPLFFYHHTHAMNLLEKEAKKLKEEMGHNLIHSLTEEAKLTFELLNPEFEQKVAEELTAAIQPADEKPISVKIGNKISTGEKRYREKKDILVRQALEKLIGSTFGEEQKTPTIACVFSGGGYRAMLCTIGSLCGLEQEELLPCITYTVGLSGSTWALAPWISSRMKLNDYKNYMCEQITKPLWDISDEERQLAAKMIAIKKVSQQPQTLVDIYGGLLGNRLLAHMAKKRHMTHLSHQSKILHNLKYPYPIYTAVSGNKEDLVSWYTFTPHKFTNLTYGISIPTSGIGRTYDHGKSTNTAPELPLSILLGTWGSAFAADWDTIITAAEDREPGFRAKLEQLKSHVKPLGKTRPIPCELKIPNFTCGMETPLSGPKNLQLVDAGTDINLPYPAISGICPGRKADITIFCDASAGEFVEHEGMLLSKEFLKCADYARRNNLPFPQLSHPVFDTPSIKLFIDDTDRNVPVVIYMPAVSDPALLRNIENCNHLEKFDLKHETEKGFCQTQHFQYELEHSKMVTDQTTCNVRANKDVIINAIRWKLDNMPS